MEYFNKLNMVKIADEIIKAINTKPDKFDVERVCEMAYTLAALVKAQNT